jgi:hypothetical protein
MGTDFQAAMRRALHLVRGQDVMEATRVIQRALSRSGDGPAEPPHDHPAIEQARDGSGAPAAGPAEPAAGPAEPGGPSRPNAAPAGEGALVGWRGASRGVAPFAAPDPPTGAAPVGDAPREAGERAPGGSEPVARAAGRGRRRLGDAV